MRLLLGGAQPRCISLQRCARSSSSSSASSTQLRYSSTNSSISSGKQRSYDAWKPPLFSRLSKFWIPPITTTGAKQERGHELLIRAGYLQQSRAGIFHMLPLGERVQTNIEKLIEKHMAQLDASKVALSSISPQTLWKKTNRLDGYGQELFRFKDRKDVPFILAPTHEEEITTVAKSVTSYKTLPLRLYQIGRKYRDEMRPRHGVLRSREFVMKDLYTFDYSVESALKTYEEVCAAYRTLFDEMKLPYLVAEADTGDIGGTLSHEFHLPAPMGDDNVISCDSCSYVANEELATTRVNPRKIGGPDSQQSNGAQVWRGISKDRKTLVNVWYPAGFTDADINPHALKRSLPDLDSSLEDALPLWESALSSGSAQQLLNIVDYRLGPDFVKTLESEPRKLPALQSSEELKLDGEEYLTSSETGELINALRIRDRDLCPRCEPGKLKVQKAIELGHTFNLGTKYSAALEAHIQIPSNLLKNGDGAGTATTPPTELSSKLVSVPMQMGCHGIGVSRIIGAVADHLSDARGLNWPRAIAPFEVVVVADKTKHDGDAVAVAQKLVCNMPDPMPSAPSVAEVDLVIDDRDEPLLSKLSDAALVGYPVVVTLGRKWKSDRLLDVQCRRLGVESELVEPEMLWSYVRGLLEKL
ncbi:class II aaRS and biotin synthetase [Xylariaceae sp. FL0594]|nr:class II aaRS and biotin synthetase [Xylariaceae sp. FL0594]